MSTERRVARTACPAAPAVWRTLLVLAGLQLATAASAGPTPAPVRAEIEALISRLETSGCSFQRNGTWHDAAEASTHLRRKLEGVERLTTLVSTEQFIELAASRSSVSGRPYQVRCAERARAAAQPSAQWLAEQLQDLRAGR